MHTLVPILRPDTVFRPRARFPMQHVRVPWQVQEVAQPLELIFGVFDQGVRIHDKHGNPLSFAGVQQAPLVVVAHIQSGGALDVLLVRGQHPNGIAREEHLLVLCEIRYLFPTFRVVGHVFQKQMGRLRALELG